MAGVRLRPWLCACALLSVALFLPGCRPGPERPPITGSVPASWPVFDYIAAAADGATVLRLAPQLSSVDVVVRREGPLARFGHDHVITVTGLEGYLLLAASTAGHRADLRFPLEALVVDSAEARQRYALTTEPDADDIHGTRDNLLQHVLDPARWPWVQLGMTGFRGNGRDYSADVSIEINGARYAGRHAFLLDRNGDRATVSGSLSLRQTELGLEPFSALGGGLRVADTLDIHFRLEAEPGSQ